MIHSRLHFRSRDCNLIKFSLSIYMYDKTVITNNLRLNDYYLKNILDLPKDIKHFQIGCNFIDRKNLIQQVKSAAVLVNAWIAENMYRVSLKCEWPICFPREMKEIYERNFFFMKLYSFVSTINLVFFSILHLLSHFNPQGDFTADFLKERWI